MRTTIEPAEGPPLVYQCALPLSRQTLTFVAGLLRGHLKKIASRWRKLPPGRIALIVLATLRHDHRLADMAGGNGVSASTIHRWTWEVIGLLAARAPRLDRALATIKKAGGEVVLLDGTLIPTRRRPGPANRKNYNGKHKKHGLLFLALTDEAGNLAWISCARRGAASEVTAARHDHIAPRLRAAGLGALADLGFTGLDPGPDDPVVITGYKSTRTRKTTPAQRQANQALSAARAPVEHGFSDLKNWRVLTRLRLDPGKATALLRALLVLTRRHTARRQTIMSYAQPLSPGRGPPTRPTPAPLTSQLRLERSHYATRDIPAEAMRLHLCWGNYEAPHHTDIPLADIIDLVLQARPQAVSFEAANPRHEHEWQVFESIRLPDGKIIMPGVIDSTTNYIEHPDLVAQRIGRYADLVGPENVIAGTDCGFATFASHPTVEPEISWAKLATMTEGARLATRRRSG